MLYLKYKKLIRERKWQLHFLGAPFRLLLVLLQMWLVDNPGEVNLYLFLLGDQAHSGRGPAPRPNRGDGLCFWGERYVPELGWVLPWDMTSRAFIDYISGKFGLGSKSQSEVAFSNPT
jgi:hypothetical protein